MRVLLINPRVSFSFWTLPDSSKMTGTKTLAPPLGLITVAALLPPEWELRLVDLNTTELKETDWQWAELVMLTGMLGQRESCLALIREAKERGFEPENELKYEAEKIKKILNRDKTKQFILVFSPEGKQIDSFKFSEIIFSKFETHDELIFIVGGHYGIHYKIKKEANLIVSFSKMIFGHQIFRIMLYEQIYRSISIKYNLNYH